MSELVNAKDKIAIVTFHNDTKEEKMGGIVTAPIYLSQLLDKYAHTPSDVIVTGKVRKYSGYKEIVKFVDYPKLTEVLNEYAYVIFQAPGHTYEKYNPDDEGKRYSYLLDGLTTEFTFIVNEENDRKLYPYYKEFVNHKCCKFVMFNSEGMHEDFPDMIPASGRYLEFNFMVPLLPLDEILEKAKHKESILTSTARWCPRKRVFELVQISDDIHAKGIKVEVAGAKQSYFAVKKILDLGKTNWEDKGYFTPDMLPELLDKTKFHYNFVFMKRKNRNRVMRPRIEIATFEALNEGCLPVLCSDLMPSWLRADSALQVPSVDFDKLPDILDEVNHSDEDRFNRIISMYHDIEENIIPMYQSIVNELRREGAKNV